MISIVGFGSHRSVAVGGVNTGVAGHSIVWFGAQVIVGGALSSTVIACEHGSD